MTMQFKDHFSGHSNEYRQYRPQYPQALFHHLSSLTKAHQRVWDCATGTGQSALSLADYYVQVIGTDANEKQIQNAIVKENIVYQMTPAEHNGIDTYSVDLITVTQALH